MAAAGGDTVVPTNWTGLILTVIAVAIFAAATYFGLGMVLGDAEGDGATKQETTLQDLYSSSARRGIEAMETVRALPRTVLAPSVSLDAPPPAQRGDQQTSDISSTDVDDDMTSAEAQAAADAAADEEAAQAAQEAAAAADRGVAAEAERMATAAADATRRAAEAAAETARNAAEAVTDAGTSASEFAGDVAASARDSAASAASRTAEAIDNRYRATTEALRAWWRDLQGSPVSVRFIGPLDSSVAPNGIAILFDQPVDAATAASSLTLVNSNGAPVDSDWNNGENANLIYAADLPPGRYTLTLAEGLTARSGDQLNADISGDAFVN
ncbi:MAG: Ig-like domain-containing protein [Oceanococcaceae bacterium]